MSSTADPVLDTVQDTSKSPQYDGKTTSIYLPDLFSSIMAVKPVVNPYYHEVKPKAESWIARLVRENDKWAATASKADLAYLASTCAPSSDEDGLRLMMDWFHWVFLFDDQFDEGHLKGDLHAAQEEIDRTLAIMEDIQPPVTAVENTIGYIFQSLWDRVKKRSSQEKQQRWKRSHRHYFEGLLEQVKVTHDQRTVTRDWQEYMNMRRRTIAVYPGIVVTECALDVHLPLNVVDHPSTQECMRVSADLCILVNDILSYKKDLAQGVDHNLITLLMEQGLSTQSAIDRIGNMIDECYKCWYIALANMPVLGEEMDRQVLKFAEACRNVALGNLHWSFKTGRYLGRYGDQVHETRELSLVQEPSSQAS